MTTDSIFELDDAGAVISRFNTCECGQEFEQHALSRRFLEMVAHNDGHALAGVTRDVPGHFVPVHCPKCERKDIRFAAAMADAKRLFRGPLERDQPDLGQGEMEIL